MNLIIEEESSNINNEELLVGLDEYQRKAVGYDLDKNLLCNSIAGSGKTHVLTRRVGYLIANGVDESSIMLLTFTNKAAKEMTERVSLILNKGNINIKSGTFHSIASKYLRMYSNVIGYDKYFSILDTNDSVKLINDIRSEHLENLNISKKNFEKGTFIQDLYSKSINLNMSLEDMKALKSNNLKIVKNILSDYEKIKKESNLMDFDDLIINFDKILDNDQVRKNIQEEVKYLLIDEYQDINYLQDRIIDKISNKERVFAVGDPSQSIYAFRGSDIKYIQEFTNKYNAEEINLKINYRSDKNVLKLAERSINNNPQKQYVEMKPFKDTDYAQKYKRYNDINSEVEDIIREIKKLIKNGVEKDEIAILIRSASIVYILESALRKNNIDYELRAGKSYFEKTHIKDLIGILTLIVNPNCVVSFKRTMSLIPGVGNKTAELYFNLFKENDYSFHKLLENKSEWKGSKVAKESLEKLITMYKELENITTVKEKIQYINNVFYKDYLYNRYSSDDNYEDRYIDIISFQDLAETADLSVFLEELTLSNDLFEDKDDDESKKVVLSTMHRAKGLEWNYVFVPNLNMGYFPRKIDSEIEEERRLFYVTLTRAKKVLYLSRSKWDNFTYTVLQPSIFINEII